MPGIDAKLEFETCDGQAWGSLHVNIVEHPHQVHQYPPQHQQHRKNDSPCKRRQRLEAAQLEANDINKVNEKAAGSAEQVSKEKINIENAATEDVPEEITAFVEIAEVGTTSPLLLPVEVRDEV